MTEARPRLGRMISGVCRLIRVLAVVTAALLAAGGLSIAESTPKHGGVLKFAVVADAPSYDCHATDVYAAIDVLAPHYSTLLRIDPEHYPQVVGDLADSWSIEDNGRTYAFHLAPAARFHDGSLLRSSDVKASFDRIRHPPPGVISVRQALYEDIVSIDTPDDRSVVFHLRKPNAAMLTLLASPWNCIYSSTLLKENPDYPAKVVMGSGPFRFVEDVPDARWSGARFDGYFKPGLPYLDGFEAYVMSPAAAASALQGGKVMADFGGITPVQQANLKRAMGDAIKFQQNTRLANFLLTFNTARTPFDDIRVRRALSLAIDRWRLEPQLRRTTIAGLVGGLLVPGSAMARTSQELSAFPGFSRDSDAGKVEARRLLAEAGQTDLRFVLTNRAAASPYDSIAIYAIDQWRQVGVAVEQQALETAGYAAARLGGNFDVIVDFASEFADEPALELAHYLSHDKAPENVSQVIDRTLDDLYERQLREVIPAAREKLVHDFEARLLDQAYRAPVSWSYRITPLAREVMGYVTTPSTHLNQDLATIWLDR